MFPGTIIISLRKPELCLFGQKRVQWITAAATAPARTRPPESTAAALLDSHSSLMARRAKVGFILLDTCANTCYVLPSPVDNNLQRKATQCPRGKAGVCNLTEGRTAVGVEAVFSFMSGVPCAENLFFSALLLSTPTSRASFFRGQVWESWKSSVVKQRSVLAEASRCVAAHRYPVQQPAVLSTASWALQQLVSKYQCVNRDVFYKYTSAPSSSNEGSGEEQRHS